MERSRALCTPRCSKWKALPPSPPTRWPSGLSSDPTAPGAGIPGPRCCLQSFLYSLHLLKLSWPTLGSLTGSQRGQIRTCPGLLGSVYLPFQPGPNPILVPPGHALPQSVAEKLWLEARVKPAQGHPLLGPPALGRGRGLDGPSPELCCPQLPRSKAPVGTVPGRPDRAECFLAAPAFTPHHPLPAPPTPSPAPPPLVQLGSGALGSPPVAGPHPWLFLSTQPAFRHLLTIQMCSVALGGPRGRYCVNKL